MASENHEADLLDSSSCECCVQLHYVLSPSRWLVTNGATETKELVDLFCDSTLGHEYDMCRLLLDHEKFSVNVVSSRGFYPLDVVCQLSAVPILDVMLMDRDMDINAVSPSCNANGLYLSCESGAKEIVDRLLLRADLDINWINSNNGATSLRIAARRGHHMVVQSLTNDSRLHRQLSADRPDTTVMFDACAEGHVHVVDVLLSLQPVLNTTCDPNIVRISDGFSPIYIACRNNHYAVVNALLGSRYTTSVNVVPTRGLEMGCTPLILSSYCGLENCVRALLSAPNLCVQAQFEEQSALYWSSVDARSVGLSCLDDCIRRIGRRHVRFLLQSCVRALHTQNTCT